MCFKAVLCDASRLHGKRHAKNDIFARLRASLGIAAGTAGYYVNIRNTYDAFNGACSTPVARRRRRDTSMFLIVLVDISYLFVTANSYS